MTGADPVWPSTSLLGRVREPARTDLLALGTRVPYGPDKEVIVQDARDTHVLLLLSGMVKVQAVDEDGEHALLDIRIAGDVVGEMAALSGKPRSATVRTCGEVVARAITRADFQALLLRRPEVAMELVLVVGERLRWSIDRRRDFLSCPAPVRVARVLVELVQTYGRQDKDAWRLGIPLTKVELASIAGMKPRTAEKAFSDLRHAGVVVSNLRRDVLVPDLRALRRYAGS
ncbi:Crp/Fnr family transcriptional regulator [Actinosynnema pretiosum]|uniref:Crp/Fnr family transcriptional regulator n=1 Tax=Actinosynnema pretiosum TaxID=42197 RepID=A0A290ZCQ2_9PSEU|nr:Crp/Fnr family transcriptional regulator [Actinosynnema pretiosum]